MKAVSETSGKTVQPKIMKRNSFPSSNQASTSVTVTTKSPSHDSIVSSTRHPHVQNAERAEGYSTDTSNILSGQRRDIDRILTSVEGLQTQILDMKNAIESLKANKNPENSGEVSPRDSNFAEEIELLTENISNISSKVHGIDGLRLELKMMKRRVQRLEHGNMSTQSSHTVTGLTQDTPRAKFARMTGSLARRSVLSGGGASHPSNGSNFIGSSVSNVVLEQSPNLSVDDDDGTAIQQDLPLMPKQAERDLGPSTLEIQSDPPELSRLDAGHSVVPTDPVSAHPVGTLRKRVSIPETNFMGSITSSSTPQPSPIPAELSPRPTTPANRAARLKPRSATSLNNHRVAPVSDSEDDDYDPESTQLTTPPQGGSRGNNRGRGSRRRHRRSAPVRLPTPEWEKPDWIGPRTTTSNTRGRGIMRRGVSGRNLGVEPDPKRRKTVSNDEGLHKDIINGHDSASLALDDSDDDPSLKASKDGKEQVLTRFGLPDARRVKRARDEHGRLLRPDGRIDRRSIRYKRGANNTTVDPQTASEDENDKRDGVDNENNNVALITGKQARHKVEKRERRERDAEGFLLKPDGTRDGRSARTLSAANPKSESLQADDAHEKLMRQILGSRR